MRITRRSFVGLLASATLACGYTSGAQASDWPSAHKPVYIIVPAPGGGGTADTISRLIADQLGKKLHGNFVIDSHGGANGSIGAGLAASAPPDGSKLLFSWAGTLAVNPSLYKKLPYDPQKSFDPIGLVADVPNILVVNNELPIHNLADFIKYAKANPGKVNFGSTGNGSSMHLAGELFMRETGTKMVHVPYNSPSQGTTDLISGQIQCMFQLIPGIIGQIQGHKVRPIGVMSTQRSPSLPDVPTMAEQGYPDLLSSTWFALLAPKGTPKDIIERTNKALNEILKDPEVKKKLAAMGASTLGGTPEDLSKHMAAERQKWHKVVTEAHIQIQ